LISDPQYLHQKYVVERLTCQQITEEVSCSRITVLKNLRAQGIAIRGTSDKLFRAGCGLAFGRKNIKGIEIDHRGEIQTIARIKDFRNQGLSYQRIAAMTNGLEIRTKTGKSSWSRKTIWNLVN
jgi:hypothetical protein